MKGYEAIAAALRDHGVEVVFGLMGNANLRYLVDWVEGSGRYVAAVEEAGALGMADGYHRVSGRLGVASVTYGPGLTNTLTPLVEAVRARSSVLVMSGTPDRRHHRQHIDVARAAELTGAGYRAVRAASDIRPGVAEAAGQALRERRPVVVDVLHEVLAEEVPAEDVPAGPVPAGAVPGGGAAAGHSLETATTPAGEALDRALGVAATVRRPVVLAGRGVAPGAAADAVAGLADRLGAPLATTLLGRDQFAGHPFDLGIFGTLSHEVALDTVLGADAVLAFGASLNEYTTARGSLLDGRAVVHCDTDAGAIGRHAPVDAGVVGDAARVATAMDEALAGVERETAGLRTAGLRTEALRSRLASRDPAQEFEARSREGTLDMRTVALALDAGLPRDRVVVTDGGRFQGAVWPYLHVTRPTDFTHTVNYGSVGLGTAVALGACVAARDRLTVCVAGDGGGAMSLMEFVTAVRQDLPFVLVVLNDGAYGAEYRYLAEAGLDTRHSLLQWPDLGGIARAMGATGLRVTSEEELEEAIGLVSGGRLPALVDVRCDPAIDLPRLY